MTQRESSSLYVLLYGLSSFLLCLIKLLRSLLMFCGILSVLLVWCNTSLKFLEKFRCSFSSKQHHMLSSPCSGRRCLVYMSSSSTRYCRKSSIPAAEERAFVVYWTVKLFACAFIAAPEQSYEGWKVYNSDWFAYLLVMKWLTNWFIWCVLVKLSRLWYKCSCYFESLTLITKIAFLWIETADVSCCSSILTLNVPRGLMF